MIRITIRVRDGPDDSNSTMLVEYSFIFEVKLRQSWPEKRLRRCVQL